MTLPTGTISMSQVNTELLISPSTTTISLNQANVRFVAGVPTGTISMNDLRGKSYYFFFTPTISANTANYNLKDAAIAAGWNQVAPLNATVTINSGVYVYSTSTGYYAFQIVSTFPSGSVISLINNGIILGMGGSGGTGGNASALSNATSGNSGGPALYVQYPTTITNNGVIAGGGGGGGGGNLGYF